MSNQHTEAEMQHVAVATAGAEAGTAAGSWVISGNTSTEECERILNGYEVCEPAIMSMCPAPLSGEYAGESIPEIAARLGVPADDDTWYDNYEESFTNAFWEEVTRAARYQCGPDVDPYFKHPEEMVIEHAPAGDKFTDWLLED